MPQTLSIVGIEVTVKRVTKLPDGDHGQSDATKREILISKEYPVDQQWRTLRHEVYHMVLGLTGLSELMSTELEEALVITLENHLSPELFEQLVQE